MCYAKRKKGQWGLAATLRQVLTGLVMLFLARGIAIGQEANAEAAAPRFMIKNGTTSLLDPLVPSFNLAVEYRWAGSPPILRAGRYCLSGISMNLPPKG